MKNVGAFINGGLVGHLAVMAGYSLPIIIVCILLVLIGNVMLMR